MRFHLPATVLAIILIALLIASPATASKKALFDNDHAETAGNADWQIDTDQPVPSPAQSGIGPSTPGTYWLGAISSWGVELVQRGYTVATNIYALTYNNPNNPYDLSKYDVLIVDEPNTLFTSAEAAAVLAFVHDGGGLVGVADHSGSDRNNDGYDSPMIWNAFDPTHLLGVSFAVSGNSNNDISQVSTNVNAAVSDSVTHGAAGIVSAFSFHNGTTMTLYPSTNPSVRGDVWMNGVSQSSLASLMAASSVYGAGRVFFGGDSSPADDGSAAPGNSSIYDGWGEAGASDSTLFINATLWVTRRGSSSDTTPPAVTVSSPNGGENWAIDSVHNLTWTATDSVGVVNLDIEYSSNNGSTWSTVAAGVANSGSYPWMVPAPTTVQARVRVKARDAASNVGVDVSDGVFTVSDQSGPAVTVNLPNGGENWAVGSSHGISWTATDPSGVGTVDIDYSTDGGVGWILVASGLANSGFRSWTVPATPTIQGLVRVTARDVLGNIGSDTSNGVFTISDQTAPSVTVSSPNGGESWDTNSPHNITWAATDNVGVTTIDIDYSTDNGGSWSSVVLGWSNSGSYAWTVPGAPTNQALVRVKAHDAAGATGSDASNAVFTISDHAAPVVAVISPVGGESWDIGSSQDITWTAADDVGVDSVNVDYSIYGLLGPWDRVAHGLANAGSYSWTVPYPPTDSAVVRVTAYDHAGNAGSAAGAALFQIVSTPAGLSTGGPSVLALARPRPNPSVGTTILRFSLPEAGAVRLEILDPSGRRLWQVEGVFPAGPQALPWQGQATGGGKAQTGVYFVRLATPWGVRSERLVWLP